MAKLTELKDLLAAARAQAPVPSPAAPAPRKPHAAAPAPGPRAGGKRAVAAAKHADGDIDLTQAFADVQKLPPRQSRQRRAGRDRRRFRITRSPTSATCCEASKYGDDPAPQTWDTGQEFEHEQTFVRSGLSPDIAGKLRRGHWSVQAELDLHGLTVDEAHDALSDFVVAARASPLPVRARHPRQGTDLARQGARAQGQGAPLARALGRGARVHRGAAPRRRRRRDAGAAQGH